MLCGSPLVAHSARRGAVSQIENFVVRFRIQNGGLPALLRNENEVSRSGISPCGGLHGGPSARREPEITNVARRAEVHRAAAVRRSGRGNRRCYGFRASRRFKVHVFPSLEGA